MTSRSSDRIGALARRRARLTADYDKARRQHRGAGKTAAKLRQATHAQLAAEINLARAAPLKRHRTSRAAAEPDMFQEAGE
ncbi:hypothetical protein SAMN02745157_1427 [Kaistia soli DSM 19436]|uniref:Uncharacterized protein n=1 Tax=Kaistia soli DSM 19436 TaxID=1122133 RepID=A0A1M4Y5X4_9HYPH|nr:hypothetical protein [Kaistia soli]SHF00852.1 hypothetical protein SAMN02745157_1427 [Kaistia soli DSM 19436]